MRQIAIAAAAACLVTCVTSPGSALASGSTEVRVDGPALLHGLRGSTVTRIGPIQQAYGVGYIRATYSGDCEVHDAPVTAVIGAGVGIVEGAWVVWDLAAVPSHAEVVQVEVEYELRPDVHNEPQIRMDYRRIASVYMPPPECWDAWQCLAYCPVYTMVEMGTEIGLRHVVLGGSAMDDVQGKLAAGDEFSVGITLHHSDMMLGTATFPGWDAGGPDLLVTWRDPSPVAPRSWGMLKALFSP